MTLQIPPSVSRFRLLSDLDSVASGVTATNTLPSNEFGIVSRVTDGGGELVIDGEYTGAGDIEIEVEITSASDGTLSASEPVTIGDGDGVGTVVAVYAGQPLESVQMTLVDAGSESIPARYSVGGAILAAITAGAGGNALQMLVNRDGLVTTALPFATVEAISAGTARLVGGGWDWGQPAADDGAIPTGALRFRFEGFPQVHRSWKVWEEGAWVYRIDPAPDWRIPADTPLLAISGSYALQIIGGTTENYSVITLWDMLSQIDARSALVRVETAITRDRRPGGMAVTDLPLITDAHALPPAESSATGRTISGIEVAATAPTEQIRVRSIGRLIGGAEQFLVSGSVSGALPTALSGERYNSRVIQFDPPEALDRLAQGRITAQYIPAFDADRVTPPRVCISPAILGARATDKRVVFTYRKRPINTTGSCIPASFDVSPLGLFNEEGGVMATLNPEYKSRLITLHNWLSGYIAGNVGFTRAIQRFYPAADNVDISLAKACAAALQEGLADVYEDVTARAEWDIALTELQSMLAPYDGVGFSPDGSGIFARPWTEVASISEGQYVYPTTRNGFLYYALSSGTSGSSEPIWPTTDGAIFIDNTVQYQAVNYWTASTTVAEGDIIEPGTGFVYKAEAAGTTGATEPQWSVFTSSYVDGTVTWARILATGARLTSVGDFTVLDIATPRRSLIDGPITSILATAYLFAGSEYTGIIGQHSVLVTDNLDAGRAEEIARQGARSLLAIRQAQALGAATDITPIVGNWRARMDYCRTLAGIIPKSTASIDIQGGQCWRESLTAIYYWVAESDDYLPAFSDTAYYSAVELDGAAVCTQEFGFVPQVSDPGSLIEGDQIVINISGTASGGVRDGDEWLIPVIAGGAKQFAGGEDGNPVQTWAVVGSSHGAYPDYSLNPSAPLPYVAGPGEIEITQGAIPFAVGDAIRFSIESGQGRWRNRPVGGAWGAWTAFNLYDGVVDIGDGLEIEARQGIAPSFVVGDRWNAEALAIFGAAQMAVSNIDTGCRWGAAGTVIDLDAGSIKRIDGVLIGMHTIPQSSVVLVQLSSVPIDGAIPSQITTLTWTWAKGAIWLPAGIDARYLRITSSLAGGIRWLWAGAGWQPTVSPSGMDVVRRYHSQRGTGMDAGGVAQGAAWDVTVEWRDGDARLADASADALMARVDYAVNSRYLPLAVVPNIEVANRAYIGILESDSVAVEDLWSYQIDDRFLAVSIAFAGVSL